MLHTSMLLARPNMIESEQGIELPKEQKGTHPKPLRHAQTVLTSLFRGGARRTDSLVTVRALGKVLDLTLRKNKTHIELHGG